MYTEITSFLHQGRLKEALTQLKVYAEKVDNWNIQSAVETLQTNYTYLLKYACEGQKDPQRNKLFMDIRRRCFELADELQLQDKFTNGYGYIADLFRTHKANPLPSFTELQIQLKQLNGISGIEVTEDNGSQHELFQPHFEFTNLLFKKTLLTLHWSTSEYNEAYKLVYCGMSPFDLEVWISAVTISLLTCFDVEKFQFLLNIYLDKTIYSVKARALVGIVLGLYYYEHRIKDYDDIQDLIDFVLNGNPEVQPQIVLIQQLLLMSRETAKIDKKMREEIIPQMMKNPYLKHTDRKFDEIDAKELEEINPEWEKDLDKMTEQIHELGKLQREGADTYMSTFAMLKHYPFFRDMAHWFYPFTSAEPTIAKIFKEKDIKENTILHMMLHSPAFCNSDKYSFALALDEIPAQQMEMMKSNTKGTEEFLNEQIGAPSKLTTEEEQKIVYRQYLHDLYRFFKLWPSRKEQYDIFKDSFRLWERRLKPLLMEGQSAVQLADYLLSKKYYEEASSFYTCLLEKNPIDNELIQKAGFALQKQDKYEEALRIYNQGYIIKPNDVWTLKHIALCHKKLYHDEKALEFLQMASEIDPDNLNLTLQVGQSLTTLGRYEEALKCFFKVEYLGQSPVNAHRAIAWCYFMTDKYDDAIRYYEKIIQETTPIISDWLNIGHVYLVQGRWKEAVSYYQKAQALCKSHDEFIGIYLLDMIDLSSKGIDTITSSIVLDLV